MQRPERQILARERHVDHVLRQTAVEVCPAELLRPHVDRCLEPLSQRVQRHAGLAVAHLAQGELELALAAEELDADPLDVLGRRGGRNRSESVLFERLGVHRTAEVTNVPNGGRPVFLVESLR